VRKASPDRWLSKTWSALPSPKVTKRFYKRGQDHTQIKRAKRKLKYFLKVRNLYIKRTAKDNLESENRLTSLIKTNRSLINSRKKSQMNKIFRKMSSREGRRL